MAVSSAARAAVLPGSGEDIPVSIMPRFLGKGVPLAVPPYLTVVAASYFCVFVFELFVSKIPALVAAGWVVLVAIGVSRSFILCVIVGKFAVAVSCCCRSGVLQLHLGAGFSLCASFLPLGAVV